MQTLASLRFDRRRVATVVALALPIALVLVMGWQRRWTADDAFVNFRVVDQIRHGNGPVFNAGERVEAFTSPIWLGILLVADPIIPLRIEWVAVVLALLSMVAAFVFVELAAVRLWRVLVGDGPFVPAGVLLLAALPPVWDYATSGLDTALGLAWLSASWWALCVYVCRARTQPQLRAPASPWICVLLGLGPLVRPDLIVMSVVFIAVLLACQTSWLRVGRAVAWCAALPMIYQLFRMAYYAALVPNTALAKEAGSTNWSKGWRYLLDFMQPYELWLPLALVIVVGAVPLVRSIRSGTSNIMIALVTAPVVAGVLHGAYVIRVGGDFMHARLLLPSLWCLLLPVGVVTVRTWQWVVSGLLVGWVFTCALTLRTHSQFVLTGIDDERHFSVEWSKQSNPVTIDDYRRSQWARAGFATRALAEHGARGLILNGYAPSGARLPMSSRSIEQPIAAVVGNIGEFGYAAGTDVFVLDSLGLSDPFASRIFALPQLAAGHQKILHSAWFIARFTDPTPGEAQDVRDARHALRCGDLPQLVDATTAPLDVNRAVQNLWDSLALTHLRFSSSPGEALLLLCGDK